jgi:multiple antibiotic resistance protein
MSDPLGFAAVTLGSVLFIVDPIAVIPTYLVITQAETAAERRSTARRACIAMSLLRRIGKTGIRVMTRIMGLLLAALAVQFVLSGVKEAFQL